MTLDSKMTFIFPFFMLSFLRLLQNFLDGFLVNVGIPIFSKYPLTQCHISLTTIIQVNVLDCILWDHMKYSFIIIFYFNLVIISLLIFCSKHILLLTYLLHLVEMQVLIIHVTNTKKLQLLFYVDKKQCNSNKQNATSTFFQCVKFVSKDRINILDSTPLNKYVLIQSRDYIENKILFFNKDVLFQKSEHKFQVKNILKKCI